MPVASRYARARTRSSSSVWFTMTADIDSFLASVKKLLAPQENTLAGHFRSHATARKISLDDLRKDAIFHPYRNDAGQRGMG
jgi:hypothetical protein